MTRKTRMLRNVKTPEARADLPADNKPYKFKLGGGVTLGYRKPLGGGPGSWILITANGKGGRDTRKLATADDAGAVADGVSVLTYGQALALASQAVSGHAAVKAPPSVVGATLTIADAIAAYETALVKKAGNKTNATQITHHMQGRDDLAGALLATVSKKTLEAWGDALRAGETVSQRGKPMTRSTYKRLMKSVRACFNLAAEDDKRIAANADAWKSGLKDLGGRDSARKALLTDSEVIALVHAAYAIDPAFGLFVQASAELGSRSDQIARIAVGDVMPNATMVPNSGKGRNKVKAEAGATRIPSTPDLGGRFTKLAADRLAAGASVDDLLMTAPNGAAWTAGANAGLVRRWFQQCTAAAGVAPTFTMIAFRHSSIVRLIMAGRAIKQVATLHNTSARMIEEHYAAFISVDDDLIRGALLNTAPVAEGGKVIPFAV